MNSAPSEAQDGKKEIETTKASRTQKIKVSFSLGENKIAKSGEKKFWKGGGECRYNSLARQKHLFGP